MEKGWQRYHTIWLMLFLGWVVSYIDRTLTMLPHLVDIFRRGH